MVQFLKTYIGVGWSVVLTLSVIYSYIPYIHTYSYSSGWYGSFAKIIVFNHELDRKILIIKTECIDIVF